jgi:hypothetical protein
MLRFLLSVIFVLEVNNAITKYGLLVRKGGTFAIINMHENHKRNAPRGCVHGRFVQFLFICFVQSKLKEGTSAYPDEFLQFSVPVLMYNVINFQELETQVTAARVLAEIRPKT